MYTRRGDKGETSLYGPRRVAKDSPRVEAYGAVDELNSLVGVVASESSDAALVEPLKRLQRLLFVAGADLAADLAGASGVPRIAAKDTLWLEKLTDELLAGLPSLNTFILPGGTPAAAKLHLARAVCRRAERRILTASTKDAINPELLPFFNRLSTYLFNLSRWANAREGKKEDPWSA